VTHPASHDTLAELTVQVRLLTDRAAISDLLVEFARTLDERDWETHTQLYLPDGELILGDIMRLHGHDQLRRTGSPQGLGQYAATWHLSSNHAITVDGDHARTRSYLLGVHLLRGDPQDEDLFRHADGAGWYDCTLRRTPAGWRFATVRIHEVWRAGRPLPHLDVTPQTFGDR
jgi:SnoaL-like domain